MNKSSAATLAVAIALLGLVSGIAHADTVVQVPFAGLLDARSVTTLTKGQLVPWNLPTDGGGLQNGFATKAAVQTKGGPVSNALPDDGRFPANARHPEVILNFSNDANAGSPQAHLVLPSASFNFSTPSATYSKLFLFFNGAAGGATVTIKLMYTGGMQTETAKVPDYYADVPASDPVLFNLATDVAKFDAATVKFETHHNITGVELHPMADKTLTQVQVDRGPEGNLIFWGATGIATSSVAGLGGAGGAAGASGSSGTAGSNSSGAAGTNAAQAGSNSGGAAGASAQASSAGMTSGAGGTNAAGGSASGSSAGASSSRPISLAPSSDSGCSCRLGSSHHDTRGLGAILLLLGAVTGRRVISRRQRLASRGSRLKCEA